MAVRSRHYLQGPSLPSVCDDLEASTKPLTAAIDGVSLGGDYEVAMSCHYRVASTRSAAGLSEVNLCLLPGASGTQRLPRLIGVELAIDFMCTGAPAPAPKEGDNAAVLGQPDLATAKVGTDLSSRRASTLTA